MMIPSLRELSLDQAARLTIDSDPNHAVSWFIQCNYAEEKMHFSLVKPETFRRIKKVLLTRWGDIDNTDKIFLSRAKVESGGPLFGYPRETAARVMCARNFYKGG